MPTLCTKAKEKDKLFLKRKKDRLLLVFLYIRKMTCPFLLGNTVYVISPSHAFMFEPCAV